MATGARISALRTTPAPRESASRGLEGKAASGRRLGRDDRLVILGLGLLFVAFAAITWKTWGSPQTDYGVELTTADRLAHGASLYEDIRYFYGPLGVYPLALAFELFGASFTTAFAFGLLQALAIFAATYALARTWLTPLFAGVATAIVIAIGFTGTLFGYVAPHTTSATFGTLAILLQLLALARGRVFLGGVAAGAAMLTRPEIAAVALAAAGGFVLGSFLQDGRRAGLRDLARLFAPALLIPLVVFAPFAVNVGAGNLLFDQLVPLDMLRIAGLRFQEGWAPFDATSAVAIVTRGLAYFAFAGSLAAAAVVWHRRGPSVRVLLPLAAGLGMLIVLDGAAHVLGAFPGTVGVIQTEARRGLLAMSWLPMAVVAVAAWAAVRARQGLPAPVSGSWPVDLAAIAAATVLATRAYDNFTTDTYAAYYAPLLVLLAVVLHQRAAERFPGARAGLLLALGAVFAALAWSAVGTGPSTEDEYEVRTARGTYLAPADTGPSYQEMLELVEARTEPGEPVLAFPLEGGLPFAANRPPALPELQFHPGVIDSRADEREAIATLEDRDVTLAVQGNARFDGWGLPVIGVDYDRLLVSYLKRRYTQIAEIGDYGDTSTDRIFARAFRVYELGGEERR